VTHWPASSLLLIAALPEGVPLRISTSGADSGADKRGVFTTIGGIQASLPLRRWQNHAQTQKVLANAPGTLEDTRLLRGTMKLRGIGSVSQWTCGGSLLGRASTRGFRRAPDRASSETRPRRPVSHWGAGGGEGAGVCVQRRDVRNLESQRPWAPAGGEVSIDPCTCIHMPDESWSQSFQMMFDDDRRRPPRGQAPQMGAPRGLAPGPRNRMR